jgi:CRISPR-associated helicase Cas3
MCIMVDPVWYETSTTPFVCHPTMGPLRSYLHQEKTLTAIRTALRERKTICLVNASMTGSGKTLANFSAAILDGTPTCGVYPTNELLADQYVSLAPFLPVLQMAVLDSAGMDDILAGHPNMRSHAHALAWATNATTGHTAILTNPDVLYLALYSLYGQMFSTFDLARGASAFRQILANYPVIAFDECHLYNAKQVANAAFIVGTAKELVPDLPHIFIFSSATPQNQLNRYLERLGLEPIDVTSTPATPSPTALVVCELVEVNLLPANLLHWQGGKAFAAVRREILDEWADTTTPQAKGVFIVDSVYEAKAMAESLRKTYGQKMVGEVHGYMDPGERAGALLRRLSVGTTTIDVGVNLTGEKRKHFLYGEARLGAQGVQRMGRIGRGGRKTDEIDIRNRVWLAVPEYVYTYLERRVKPTQRRAMSRELFTRLFTSAYFSHEDFEAYTRIYSPLEAVAACQRFLAQDFGDSWEKSARKLHWLVSTLYNKEPPATQEEAERSYAAYHSEQQRVWREFGTAIREAPGHPPATSKFYLSDLESFRGGLESDLIVALYDDLDAALGLKPVKTYTLPSVLRRTEWEELSTRAFHDLIRREHPAQADAWIEELERQRHLLGYLRVKALVQGEANTMAFEVRKRAIKGVFHQVIRLSRLSITAGGGGFRRGDDSILGRLSTRWLNCWISEQDSFSVSRGKTRYLPPLFKVYPLWATSPGGHVDRWSIAFGQDAFFLGSIYREASP